MNALRTVCEGHGPTVVLSHALGCDLSMWDGLAALLASRFSVLRYDHRGHGASPAGAGAFDIDTLADDAARVITGHSGGAPVHFVGLSMGGMVAQSLAVRHPGLLASIVIANSAACYDAAARAAWQQRIATVRAQGVAAIAEGAMERWFTPAFRADVLGGGAARVAQLRARLEATDPVAYAQACAAVAAIDFRAAHARIACPALVIAGSRDTATPPALSEAIAAGIAGARLATIDAAHLSAVEQPEAFARLLVEFWEGISA